jgi:hypothetical protein
MKEVIAIRLAEQFEIFLVESRSNARSRFLILFIRASSEAVR